jgi:hypothetical protein
MLRVLVLLLGTAVAQDSYATFHEPGGRFEFRYPAWWQLYSGTRIAAAASLSYIPLCDASSIACVAEPAAEVKNSNFGGASFQIGATAADNESACLKPATIPAFEASRTEPVRTVNGIRFVHGSTDGVATGHSMHAEIYRTFHGGVCYEARISTTQTSIAIAPQGTKKFSPLDQERLEKQLSAMLDSLRLLHP